MQNFRLDDMLSRIKDLKKEKNINSDQLAAMSGISVSTLNKILSGVSDSVKLENAVAIAAALGVSMNWLVYGIPDNTNNYTLYSDEIEMIEQYRTLDKFSRRFIRNTVDLECSRAAQREEEAEAARRTENEITPRRAAKELKLTSARLITEVEPPKRERMRIELYDIPVSAGPGEDLGSGLAVPSGTISIPVDSRTSAADFAVRISGNSMEPKFHSGDILLVESTETISEGELGIFTLDNCSYFKIYRGDRLESINPEYSSIMLRNFESIKLNGRVLGKLKKSTARK